MRDTLLVPHFRRLDEYAGCWLMEPAAFAAHWSAAAALGLAAHVESGLQAPPAPACLTEKVPGRGGKSVAVVKALGVLMKQRSSLGGTSTIDLRREVRAAAADPDVGAILLAIDSPGGSAAGTDDLARDVKAARARKPVWAHIDDLGASAAYWVASQAGQVFANSNTALVGSIGTYLTIYDVSEAAGKAGVKALHFATGPLKGAGTPGVPVTDEQRAYFQATVDALQAEFDRAVRLGRGLSERELAGVRGGGVFPAQEAASRRLIDGVRPLEKTLDALADAAGARARGATVTVPAGVPAARGGGIP